MLDLLQGFTTDLQSDADPAEPHGAIEPTTTAGQGDAGRADSSQRADAAGRADAGQPDGPTEQPTGSTGEDDAGTESREAADDGPADDDAPVALKPSRGRGGLELTVPLETLMGLADDPGELGSWGPILADVARKIAHDMTKAQWRFSVTDDAGRVIWNGPTRRRPTAGDAEYVRARDRRCRFPSCRRRARRCHIDHTHEHQHGRPSIPCNLGCLCARHHKQKSMGRWQLWQIPDGTFVWRSPLGRTYVVHPEPAENPDDELD